MVIKQDNEENTRTAGNNKSWKKLQRIVIYKFPKNLAAPSNF
jgi:hypothetical protein